MPALRRSSQTDAADHYRCRRVTYDRFSRYICSRVKSCRVRSTGPNASYLETSHHILPSPHGNMVETISPTASPKDLNIQELELMVQWCTATYRSISRNKNVECIWHAIIPREGMRHPFLMHGILALSALHLAFTSSGTMKEHYLMTALSHRSQARVDLAKVKANLTDSNTNAVFALSNILIVFAFALPLTMDPHDNQTPLDELCEVFRLIKASGDTIPTIIDRVSQGEMKQLVEYEDPPLQMPNTSRLAIMALSSMNAAFTTQDPDHENELYSTAIKHLGDSLDKLSQGGEIMVVAFQWIFCIPPRFIDLLEERQPFALIILAHYAVILYSLRGHWWMGEWGSRLISQVGQHIGAESKQSISWVLDATGCYIPPL
ncbi:hypothetical protein BDV28DRAFT_83171 [Aspergillus coremiiformis]|uniref:Zn(II)2Cys6 transcription factor n=1 Tax=Aspergillus coremiiformis TaxID=138285 RepID=A0A5N6ZKI1_9EURO|nr:hypothetical protein BDV28DRAFT_83171 [Aspergillus coremiiformis]